MEDEDIEDQDEDISFEEIFGDDDEKADEKKKRVVMETRNEEDLEF